MTALILSYAGWALISGTMSRHRRSWPLPLGRIGGVAAIGAALAFSVADAGWHIGPVHWCAALTASAFVHLLVLWYTRGRGQPQE